MRKRSAAPAFSNATLPMMGRKVLLAAAAFCCIAVSKTLTDAKKASITFNDNVGQSSIQRLYRNVPVGVYASASPYAAFSFHVPTFASSPKYTQVGPIKQGSVAIANTHGLLKDSYGNKFVDAPQKLAYRTTLPQQYVQLQELPAHLAQPLVSAAPSFQYKQATPHFFGPNQFKVQTLQASLPNTANLYGINQLYGFPGPVKTLAPPQQQQYPTNNKVVYLNTHASEQFKNLKNLGSFERLEEIPNTNKGNKIGPTPGSDKAQLINAATAATVSNGKKAVFSLATKPPVPLLDLSLLEPLTFANPLVPQVQHFLPRINSVKYHKLPQLNGNEIKKEKKEMQFIIQDTKTYDSGVINGKPKINAPKKTQERPQSENEDTYEEQVPSSPTGSPNDESNEAPEISYEISSPNYKETYKEMVVSYNKETQSEPAHYNYDKKTEKKPVHYHFVHTSKEPLQVKNVHFESNGQNPKPLVYNFKSGDNNEEKSENQSPQQNESEDSSEESDEDEVQHHHGQRQGGSHDKDTYHRHENPEHREEEYHQKPVTKTVHKILNEYPQAHSQVKNIPVQHAHFQPIITEYEENIRIVPTPKHYAPIKVDPNQLIQHGQVPLNHNHQDRQSKPHHSSPNYPSTHQKAHHQPEQHIHEKTKRVIIKEETPDDDSSSNEQVNDEEAEQDEKNEEDFENGYKNAAFGFPAYESTSRDTEKEIYNPDSYGQPQYHTEYDIEHSPFQQYQLEGDEFPKSTRSNYKDARDKTKEEYYLDYGISKPESMAARYRQKEDYFKMFEKRKPEYTEHESDDKKQTAKYTAAPSFEYYGSVQKPEQYVAKYKEAIHPQVFEHNYPKQASKDSSAHATRPYQRLKTHTQFVEPQFQYGFEPSALPRLLDSELAAMASNNRPESEKPNSRKKIFKENWYIKKMSTGGRLAAS